MNRQQAVKLVYTNYKGETSERHIIPKGMNWGSTPWHPEPQWLVVAYDLDKKAYRDFALRDFRGPMEVVSKAHDRVAELEQEKKETGEKTAELLRRLVEFDSIEQIRDYISTTLVGVPGA